MSVYGDLGSVVAVVGTASGWVALVATRLRGRRERKRDEQRATEHRNWHGYIELGGVNTWQVRVLEYPDHPTARVVLEVIDNEGAPDVNFAQNMRQTVDADGIVARAPTTEEWEFLKALKKERGYGNGGHIVR